MCIYKIIEIGRVFTYIMWLLLLLNMCIYTYSSVSNESLKDGVALSKFKRRIGVVQLKRIKFNQQTKQKAIFSKLFWY